MSKVIRRTDCLLAALLLAASAAVLVRAVPAAPAPAPVSTQDVLRANMQASVDPGADFSAYANGGWLARNPIPATDSWWGIGKLVQQQLDARLRAINEQAAASPAPP